MARLQVLVLLIFIFALAQGNFVDRTSQAGLLVEQQPIPLDNCIFHSCIPDGMTGGVAAGDYNNDGLTDLFVSRLFERDMLYRNNGDGTFSDVSMAAGLSMSSVHRSNGVLWCDIDNDNDLDLYVLTLGSNEINPNGNRYFLYVNNGDGTFTEDAVARGVAVNDGFNRFGTSATCGDFNNDGLLDLHINQWDQVTASNIQKIHTKLFVNTGDGYFEDVSSQHDFRDYSKQNQETNFASAFVDMDRDGDQDLLISGDFGLSQYYLNDKGTFREYTEESRCCEENNGMGIAFGDIDRNGFLDWFITAIIGSSPEDSRTGNRLYTNNGNNVLTDATDATNTRDASWGWGALFVDIDNDSDLDLIATNGQWTNQDKFQTDPTMVWENVNGDGSNMVERHADFGIHDNSVGKSVIGMDYDNDGDMDIVISQTGPGIVFYENRFDNNNDYLKVKTPGTQSNKMGIGAQISVWIREGEAPLYQEMGVASHYHGHGDSTMALFGLGSGSNDVFRVEVYWPVSRITQVRNNVKRNSVLIVEEINDNSSSSSNSSPTDSSTSSDGSDSSSSSDSSSALRLIPCVCVALASLLMMI